MRTAGPALPGGELCVCPMPGSSGLEWLVSGVGRLQVEAVYSSCAKPQHCPFTARDLAAAAGGARPKERYQVVMEIRTLGNPTVDIKACPVAI